jgi:hypothetical protein
MQHFKSFNLYAVGTIILAVLCSVLSPKAVLASNEFTITPAQFELGIVSTNSLSREIEVSITNATNIDQTFIPFLSRLAVNNLGEITNLQRLDSTNEILLVPAATNVMVRANTTAKYKTQLGFSQSLSTGSHYYLLTFATEATNALESQVNFQITTLITFTIAGDLSYRGELDVAPQYNPILTNPASVQVSFDNQGNTTLAPIGVLNLRPVIGLPFSASYDFNNERKLVFREQTRDFPINLELNSPGVLGLYELEGVVAYGPQHRTTKASTYVLLIPWYWVMLGSFILLLCIRFIYNWRRHKLYGDK